jgi:hypothetical protein
MTTAITGKSCTFSYGALDGSAQITTATIDEAASSETIQTLAGSVAISQGVESTVSAEFLYDGDMASGSFYAALKAALDGSTTGTLTIEGGTGAASAPSWTGEAIVTSLSAEMPADGAVTCSAEFAISGSLPFTPGV